MRQTRDGLVTVERQIGDRDNILIRTSPSNGKVRFDSRMVQVTASLGQETVTCSSDLGTEDCTTVASLQYSLSGMLDTLLASQRREF